MTYPHGGASEIWRDGAGYTHNPRKSQVRDWGAAVENRIVAAESTGQTNDAAITAVEGRATTLEGDVATLQASQVSGLLVRATWAELQADSGAVEGDGAEVLDSDTGTHSSASATGYDGAAVNNAGRYSWNATWSRWVRVGDTGLSARAPKSAIQLVPVTQTNVSDNYFITEPIGVDQLSATAGFTLVAPSDRQMGEFGGVIFEVAGLNSGDPRQVRYYPGDATEDQIEQMAWKAGDRLEIGPLTAGGWFPLIWPPRPVAITEDYDTRRDFYAARSNQIAAIGAQE